MTSAWLRGFASISRRIWLPVTLAILTAAPVAGADPKTFEVRGLVEKLIPDRSEVVIRHEAIPGYMEAMAMPFHVLKSQDLIGLGPGDTITFRLNVTKHEGWIDHVKVIAPAPPGSRPSKGPSLPNLNPIQVGQPFPDATLIDEHGIAFTIKSYNGNAVAITFIFTRCPYPDFCPRITDTFATVKRNLSADPHAPKNWRLLSITIDPDHDTPAVLRSYAEAHQADPAHWKFATGSLRAITTLALLCGLNFWDENGLIQHNLRTIVIDAGGKVRRVFSDNQWKPAELERELREGATAR